MSQTAHLVAPATTILRTLEAANEGNPLPPPPIKVHDVVVVIGTRPEAVKLQPVVARLGRRARVVHTGQHFDQGLWTQVAGDLELPQPHHRIEVGGLSRGEQIGLATAGLTAHLLAHPPSAVVVQGDTNSTLAGALAANACGIPLVHVEAGLRSGDRAMPEESNRLLVDQIADVCCAPIHANAVQLAHEGVADDRIAVTGSTLPRAVAALLPERHDLTALLRRHAVAAQGYVLATMHRAGNVEDPATLDSLLTALDNLGHDTPVLLPMHPNTRARAEAWGLVSPLRRVRVLGPLAPVEFLALESAAGLLVSDSGGVQEEAALFGVPLVILRDTTERPELLGTWARLLGRSDPTTELRRAWRDAPTWRGDIAVAGAAYPDVDAADHIVDALDNALLRRP